MIRAGEGRGLPTSGDFLRAGFVVSTAVARADRPGQGQGALQEPREPGDEPDGGCCGGPADEGAGDVEGMAGEIAPTLVAKASAVKKEDSAQVFPRLPEACSVGARCLRATRPEDGYSTSS
ncbi:hypothetical protein [Pseudodesulfovibrio pelocollis]|uniref:hypothetical protein n=1 Tax=Pseudodesulfovibrio pelocollis TaxID=3051432 RepID=UPI00255A8086|nr:hypothetical protein [Pseudodesulfovibrio sp. SB368]